MATIGEILEKIRNGGMNPVGTGDSPYGGETPGSHSPIAQTNIDDISPEIVETISDYLSQRTKGFEKLEEKNNFPLEPDPVATRLTDASTGNPAPLRNVQEGQSAFVSPNPASAEELSIRDGFAILDRLGFFEDLAGEDGPEYDKNAQTDGHNLLNRPDVRSKTSAILSTTRFSAMTNPDAPFADRLSQPYENIDFIDPETGVKKDHPQIEKIKQIAAFVTNTGQRAQEAFPDAKLQLARDPAATNPISFGESANLEYGEINPENGIDPATGQPDSTSGASDSPADGNNTAIDFASSFGVVHSPDFPFGADATALGAELLKAKLDLALEILDPALELMNGLFGLFSYNGILINRPENPASLAPGARFGFGNFTPPSVIDFETGEIAEGAAHIAANIGYKFVQTLNLPLPRFSLEATGSPNDLIKNMIRLGFQHIKNQIDLDPGLVNYWKNFIRKMQNLLSAENNFGLPEIPPVGPNFFLLIEDKQFMESFRDCGAMQFIRSMMILSESIAATSTSGGSALQPQPYRFSKVRDLNRLANSPINRHRAGRGSNQGNAGKVGLGAANLPSLLLLPRAFVQGANRFYNTEPPAPDGAQATTSNASVTLERPNTKTSINFDNRLLQSYSGASELSEIEGSAMLSKLGDPAKPVDTNRFSRAEVEAIENMLEAEHTPFYFHDLRTNEIVSFHAFLNALSDSFSPAFQSTSGFGRIEDVHIYEKTTRAIQVDFTLVSMTKADMTEMYYKMNKLVTMVYPQFSRGTMLEHQGQFGTTRFVQPFSQVTTATPVIRLRVGDLIKSNYSREAVARLMGVADEGFQILEPGPGTPVPTEAQCQDAIARVIERTERVPLDSQGQYDGLGWPVGCTVILDPPYDPLVAFDPNDQTASSDRSAKIVEGKIGVKILEYIAFANPLGGTSPNAEEIIIKCELVPMAPAPGFPNKDRIATRLATGEPITTALLSYRDINTADSAALICHGINLEFFPDIEIAAPGFEPFPDDVIADARDDMRDRLFGDKNPIMKSFETTAGRGLAGVITSLNFDWGLNGEINWDIVDFGYRAPTGCKISISFTPIHDIVPGIDNNGMMRAAVFNVAGSSPHSNEDPHPSTSGGFDARSSARDAALPDADVIESGTGPGAGGG